MFLKIFYNYKNDLCPFNFLEVLIQKPKKKLLVADKTSYWIDFSEREYGGMGGCWRLGIFCSLI